MKTWHREFFPSILKGIIRVSGEKFHPLFEEILWPCSQEHGPDTVSVSSERKCCWCRDLHAALPEKWPCIMHTAVPPPIYSMATSAVNSQAVWVCERYRPTCRQPLSEVWNKWLVRLSLRVFLFRRPFFLSDWQTDFLPGLRQTQWNALGVQSPEWEHE